MRKKFLGLLTAAFVLSSVTQNQVFAGELVTVGNTETENYEEVGQSMEKLAAPTNVRFTKTDGYVYDVSWDAVENADGRYEIVICKDGVDVESVNCIFNISKVYSAEIGYYIEKHGTGNYTVKVRAKALATFKDSEADSEYSVTAESFAYKRPETQLANPTDLQWNGKVITWNPVYYADNMDKYAVILYRNGEPYAMDNMLRIHYPDTGRVGYDFLKKMTKSGVYTVGVAALSMDINSVASSGLVISEPYAYKVPVEEMDNIEAFVERMYTIALNRESEIAGLSNWADGLQYWKTDAAGMAYNFIMGEEFALRNLNDEQFVDVLYKTFLDRDADESGQTYWVYVLQCGFSRGYVLREFVHSEEFATLCNSFGIRQGVMYGDGVPVNVNIVRFVEKLYLQALGRASDSEGLSTWSVSIATKAITPQDAALGFFTSQEYLNMGDSHEEYVERLYIVFLGRQADSAGKANWVAALSAGMSREDVLKGFAQSAEFAIEMSTFGL